MSELLGIARFKFHESTHRIEPDKGDWRNTRRDPGRWPGSQQTG
jgi:hypothetical protein